MISGVYSGVLRLAFRIYFIGTLTLIGLIGSQCCKCAAKLDLLHGQTVSLHRMTGWLRASDIAACVWKLRRLPGGLWLGIMMVIVSIITLTADLAVNILVYDSPRPGLCEFKQGLVMNWTAGTESFFVPPPNSYPALIASNAQIFSPDNGCDIGIFRKVPWSGDPLFCANGWDNMGSWACRVYGDDYNFNGDADVQYIGDWLYNNSLQYELWYSTEYTNRVGQPSHVAIWSSSANGDELGSTFDVLASVDLNGTYTGTKTIRTYQCQVISDSQENLDEINSILKQMGSNTTLEQWASGLDGVLYLGDGSDIEDYANISIAQRLNALTMVQGGSNTVNSTYLDGDTPWYGCLVNDTYISPAIMALVAFTGLCLVSITTYWFSLVFRLGAHALPSFVHGSDFTNSIKPVPDSILSWMLQASRENALGSPMAHGESTYLAGVPKKERELHNWGFSVVDPGGHIARMVRTRGNVAPHVEQVYMNGEQK